MTDPARSAARTRAIARARLPSMPWIELLAFVVFITLLRAAGA